MSEKKKAANEEPQTVTVTDLNGTEIEVPVGLDGVNPVSPNNPSLKSVPEDAREEALARVEAERKHAEELAEEFGAGKEHATLNKEDNVPVVAGDANEDEADKDDDSNKAAAKKAAAPAKKN